MKYSVVWISIFVVPFLTQCTSSTAPATNAVTGPFDSRGNYVEAWADTPSKWHRPSASTPTSVAPNPIRTGPVQDIPANVPDISVSVPQVTSVQPRPPLTTQTAITTKPKPKAVIKPKVVTKPKPKPKLATKPKPVAVRYTIKRGDSLGRIASKYGVSAAALRRANRISGDMIHPGKVLTIPK